MHLIRDDQRLDGWKAIANFLGRERTTAIRWANERGLPVHRIPGGRTGTVYALAGELEAWLSSDTRELDQRDRARPLEPVEAGSPAPARPRTTAFRRAAIAGLSALMVLAAVLVILIRRGAPQADPPVSVAAIAAPSANRETREFARGLNADLARFANASPTLAVFEHEPGTAPETEYAIRTEIDRAEGRMIADARLIAVDKGQVLWSRRFEQASPSLAALREQVAANIVGILRCSFGGLGEERAKARPGDVAQLMAICQSFKEDDLGAAQARARQLTAARPDLAAGWALLAMVQANMLTGGAGDDALRAQAMVNSQRAEGIAPDSVSTWLAKAAATGEGPTSPAALPILDEALRRHPDDPWLLASRSVILFNLGYVKASVPDALGSVRNDPSSFSGRDIAVRRLAAAGRTDEALQMQAENERLWPGHPFVAANRARIGGDAAAGFDVDAAIHDAEREFATAPHTAYVLAWLYERKGDRNAALSWLARAPSRSALQQWSLLFWPDAAGLRTEPAFFRKMADLGLVRWWVARQQWPDFCSEPGLKYRCADELRKLPAAG